jgi:CBS domain-containing protein
MLELDTILCAMAMGFLWSIFHLRRVRTSFTLVEKFTPPVYVLFFVLVGAKLNIGNINSAWWQFLRLFFIPGGTNGGKFLGAFLGSVISKAPKTVRKYLPFCLLSQAGVAVGLSVVAGQTFPEPLGSIIVMVITTTTFVVQIIGPPSVKFAVDRAGESGLNVTEDDLLAKSSAADLMTGSTLIEENQTVEKVLEIFSNEDNLIYPVIGQDKEIKGIISIENLKEMFLASELSPYLLAHDIMMPLQSQCSSDTPALEAFALMKKNNSDYLVLTDKKGLCMGILEEARARKRLSLQIMDLKNRANLLAN